MKPPSDRLLLAARVLVALPPLVAAVHHARHLPGTAAFLKDAAGLPGAGPGMAAAFVAVEALGGGALLVGWRTRAAAQVLALYTGVMTLAAHLRPALALADPVLRDAEYYDVLRGMAAVGAFLAIAATGPGRHSVEAR